MGGCMDGCMDARTMFSEVRTMFSEVRGQREEGRMSPGDILCEGRGVSD
jgi:hypothetical protein